MTSPSSSPPANRRHPALVTLDVVAGIILLVVGLFIGLGVLVSAISYGSLHGNCTPADVSGLTCNSTVLGIVVYGLIGVSVVAWFLGLGYFIVFTIRRRVAFYWPLIALALTVALFYLGTWVAGLTLR